jgi:hypothetical protein
MSTVRWTVVEVPTMDKAEAVHATLIAAGLDSLVEPPYVGEPSADNMVLITVPVAQHQDAFRLVAPSVHYTEALLHRPRAWYYRTSDPSRVLRVTHSPEYRCAVVSRPEWAGQQFGEVSGPMTEDAIFQLRQVAQEAGLRLYQPERRRSETYAY